MTGPNNRSGINGAALRAVLTRPVAFHPVLARLCGSVAAGLMLSQALYWTEVQERTNPAAKGWFYKRQWEWTEETCLTRTEQESARKKLRELGFLEEERREIPAKLFFRVALQRVWDAIAALSDPDPDPTPDASPENSSLQETCKLDCGEPADKKVESVPPDCRKPANKSAADPQSFSSTESTSESTSQNTSVITSGHAMKVFLAGKERLKEMLSPEEWNLWVRPARLLRVMDGNTLLVGVPRSKKIMEAAHARRFDLCEALGVKVATAPYPDEDTDERIARRHGSKYCQWLGKKRRGKDNGDS